MAGYERTRRHDASRRPAAAAARTDCPPHARSRAAPVPCPQTSRRSHRSGTCPEHGRLWNEFVARYHYLGYSTLLGAQMRYRAAGGEPLAVLGFGAAAWKIAPRDKLVGWDPETRRRNLPLAVDNAGFLILPWPRVPYSRTGRTTTARRPGGPLRVASGPALLRDPARNLLPCCQLDQSRRGRGKLDIRNERNLPVKDIWLKPLRRDWRRILNE